MSSQQLARATGISVIIGLICSIFFTVPVAGKAAEAPNIAVSDQVIHNGTILISRVFAAAAGWIVVTSSEPSPGITYIGLAYVPAGESLNVTIPIDTESMTPFLTAALYQDGGRLGRYDPPSFDPSVKVAGKTVSVVFRVLSVTIDDQFVTDREAVTISRAVAQADGWLAIHADSDGFPVIGYAPIKAGITDNLTIPIAAGGVTPQLTAVIHVDAGVRGTFEYPGADGPAGLNGDVSGEPFWTVEHIRANDQTLTSDVLTLQSVLLRAGGWVTVRSSLPDLPIIGQVLVKAGLNKALKIKIGPTTALTATLLIGLNVDAGTKGKFEYPGPDKPVVDANGQLLIQQIQLGPSLRASDQSLNEIQQSGKLVIDEVIAQSGGWLVISAGEAGPALAKVYVRPGQSLHVLVPVDMATLTSPITATLHNDAGKIGVYEYPGADDVVQTINHRDATITINLD